MIVGWTVKAGPNLVWPQRVVRDITILTLPNIKSQATIFLFLGLRISWRQIRVGRSEKKKKIFQKVYYVKL